MTSPFTIRASSAGRILACAGSVALERSAPSFRDEDSGGESGTRIHKELAKVVRGEPPDWSALKDDERGVLAGGVAILAELEKDLASYPERMVETPMRSDFTPGLALTGHPDALFFDIGQARLLVLDFKTGWQAGDDPESYRAQLLAYAGLHDYPEWAEIVLLIAMPRTREVHRLADATMQELVDFNKHLASQARRGLAGDPADLSLYHAGAHCRWCPFARSCPAQTAMASEAVTVLSAMVPTGGDGADVQRAVAAMPPEEVAELRRQARALRGRIESFEDAVRARVERDGPLDLGDGRELALSEENRRTVNWQAAKALLVETFGEAACDAVLSVSHRDVLDLAASKAGRGGMKAAKDALAEKLQAVGAISATVVRKLVERKKAPQQIEGETK